MLSPYCDLPVIEQPEIEPDAKPLPPDLRAPMASILLDYGFTVDYRSEKSVVYERGNLRASVWSDGRVHLMRDSMRDDFGLQRPTPEGQRMLRAVLGVLTEDAT